MFKSTVDWCEANYSVTYSIAEFWNTLSGIAIAISAVLFKLQYQYVFSNKYFFINYVCLLTTSIGTILFHATLLFLFQLLDELPMLLISMTYVELLNSLRLVVKQKRVLSQNVTFALISVIPIAYMIHHSLQIILFHTLLKLYEYNVLYILFYTINNLDNVFQSILNKNMGSDVDHHFFKNLSYQLYNKNYLKERMTLTNHIYKGVFCYVLGVFLWCLENLFCVHLQHLQLHALWHVFSSIGIYHLNNIVRILYDIDQILHKIE